MADRIRSKLTYANVVATIALFLVVGGVSFAAATTLPADSVGTQQLKPGAVTTSKLADGAVTAAMVKSWSLTGAQIKNGSLTGAQINAATLGTVPNASHAGTADSSTNATHAGTADSSTNATHATDADQLGGLGAAAFYPAAGIKKIDVTQHCAIACAQTALDAGPFRIRSQCSSFGTTIYTDSTGPNADLNWYYIETVGGNASPANGGALGATQPRDDGLSLTGYWGAPRRRDPLLPRRLRSRQCRVCCLHGVRFRLGHRDMSGPRHRDHGDHIGSVEPWDPTAPIRETFRGSVEPRPRQDRQ